MKPSAGIHLIMQYVMIILSKRFAETKAQIQYARNQSQPTSRDVYYTTTFDQDISRRTGTSTEIPVAFKAPDLRSQNYWSYGPQGGPDRRTFFEDFKYLSYGNGSPFPNLNSFFEFMSPLFDKDKPKPPPVSKPSEPYKYEYPFKYLSSTEQNFLPPPKPLRASIVKLETVTKPHDWQAPYGYVTPPKPIVNFQSLPTEKPDTLYIDELGFHSNSNINFRRDPNWLSQMMGTIYPTSEPEEETTTQQITTELNPKTGQVAVNEGDPDIKNASTLKTKESKDSLFSALTEVTPDQNDTKPADDEESKKTLQLVITNTVKKYKAHNLKNNKELGNNTVIDSTEGTVKPYKTTNAIKIVTDLTLEGLQKNKKDPVNLPRYTKLLNMSNLINYELNKLKQYKLMKPRSDVVVFNESKDQQETETESYTDDGFVDDNDELSLDLKILKDTNWDGFTTESISKQSSINPEFEIIYVTTNRPIPHVKNATSNLQNAQNTSTIAVDNKENIGNKTVIVETRVTKSVSKILAGKVRKFHPSKRLRDPRKEADITLQKDNQLPNLKVEKMEINATEDATFPPTTEQTEREDKDLNKTSVKTFEVIQENSRDDNQTVPETNFSYRSRRRKYRPFIRNTTTNNSILSTTETTPLPGTEIVEQKDETLNNTTINNIETSSDGEISVSTEISHTKTIDDVSSSKYRRRKPKRTSKSKRRRTGKRRKVSTTTEGTNIN